MHLAKLSLGMFSMAISLYLFLGLFYPFASPVGGLLGSAALLVGGLTFGSLGCLVCWGSVMGLEDRKTIKKVVRKRKRKLVALQG